MHPDTYDYKTQPYEHQMEALRQSWDKEAFALLMEMGTGKTKVAIDTLSMLYESQRIRSVLILAPKGVYRNWTQREMPVHMPDRVLAESSVFEWVSGLPKKARESLETTLQHPGLRICAMNTEALSRPGNAQKVAAEFARDGLVIIDESTMIKSHNSKRTKSVVEIAQLAKYRRILTGSPAPNGPLDIYGQFMALDWKILGQRNFFAWRSRYAVMQKQEMRGRSVPVVVGYRNQDELRQRIAPFSYRVRKDECLDLPPKVYLARYVDLTDEQSRVYRELKQYAFAELDDSEMVHTSTVLSQILRLHQVACGFTVTSEGEERALDSNRTQALMDVAQEAKGPTIVWANYRRSIRDVVATLRGGYDDSKIVQYWGETGPQEREDAIRRFQEDGTADYFVANPQTAGRGLTLTRAENVVYFSNNWDLEQREQSEDRAHRAGLEHTVTYTDLIAEGTVDQKIIGALRRKINLATHITGDDYRQWLV